MPIIEQFHVPLELTIDFLGTFARFEYALKRSGYATGDEHRVDPDWTRFGHEVAALPKATLDPVIATCAYLQAHPPKKQVLLHGQLAWKVRGASGGAPIEEILLSVRTVRNNVFHGGKFSEGQVMEPLRDQQLIGECLAVLHALLACPELPGTVAAYFRL